MRRTLKIILMFNQLFTLHLPSDLHNFQVYSQARSTIQFHLLREGRDF